MMIFKHAVNVWLLFCLVCTTAVHAKPLTGTLLTGRIHNISDFGNLDTSIDGKALKSHEFELGKDYFLQFKSQKIAIHYGTTYSDVEIGQWVFYLTADGSLRIAINYDNAARLLQANINDQITLAIE